MRTQVAGPYAFTAADETNVSADSTNWTEQNGSTSFVRIRGNAYFSSHGNACDCRWNGSGSFTSDQYAEIDVLIGDIGGTDQIGINLRNNGGSFGSHSMYRVIYQRSSETIEVYKVVNGTPTQLGADITGVVIANGDNLSAEAVTNGSNVDIICYHNTTAVGTRTDTSSVLTGGKPGVTAILAGSEANFGDNWVAGNVTAVIVVEIGLATETDSALASTHAKTAVIGQPSETDLAQSMVLDGTTVFLDLAHGRELKNVSGVIWANTEFTFAWYDFPTAVLPPTLDPVTVVARGTFTTNASGEAEVPIPATALSAGQSGAMCLTVSSAQHNYAWQKLPIGP